MGLGGRFETHEEDRCTEIQLGKHGRSLMGWRRSSERQDNATRSILLLVGNLVATLAKEGHVVSEKTLYGAVLLVSPMRLE
jgi:hypothetical protein